MRIEKIVKRNYNKLAQQEEYSSWKHLVLHVYIEKIYDFENSALLKQRLFPRVCVLAEIFWAAEDVIRWWEMGPGTCSQ